MASNQILRIVVKSFHEMPEPSPHIIYKIEIHSPIRVWVVQRRYSEFDTFLKSLKQMYPQFRPPELPPKQRNPFKSKNPQDLEERKKGLELFLNDLLNSSIYAELKLTDLWKDFLQIPLKEQNVKTFGRSVEVDEWMDEYRELESLSRDVAALVNYTNRINTDNNNNNSLEAKKMFTSFGIRLKALSEMLGRDDVLKTLTDGEILRRRDLVENLKLEKEKLSKILSSVNHLEERTMLLSSKTSTPTGTRRVFGVPLETEDTKHLDNNGILQLQQEMMNNQDSHLDALYTSVVKQKDLSKAIGDELDTQNKLLADLEVKVDTTSTRLQGATKAADRLI